MTTRRARNHKGLVEFEKKYHHRAGIHLHQHRKHRRTRGVNLLQAVCVESACEWHDRWQYPELAQKLYELGPVSINFGTVQARELWELLEALNHD